MRKFVLTIAAVPLLATGGCVKTAWNVATMPVRAVGKGVDLATTSPRERDEKYVRQQRKQAEREQRERRDYERDCRKKRGDCAPYDGYVAGQRGR
ncbi:hypothetical protein KZ810_14600 [Sphingomonas sp. RHCKR47]|uniref:hypothetical protein n=1 Tax=Sphingomonas citricola TaxID=2862498 RepID=UPI001CA5D462|nr:hypothetical protein [Sphingomonas citricola]MBW6524731.1 hypothetical protein [Sphingomonas citricola]